MSNNFHMVIGDGLGDRLYEIAQEKLLEGNIQGMYDVYTKSLMGFEKGHVDMIMSREYCLVTNDNALELSNNKNIINERHHTDYEFVIDSYLEDLGNVFQYYHDVFRHINPHLFTIKQRGAVRADKIAMIMMCRQLFDESLAYTDEYEDAYDKWDNIEWDANDDWQSIACKYVNYYKYLSCLVEFSKIYRKYIPMFEYITKIGIMPEKYNKLKDFEKLTQSMITILYEFIDTRVPSHDSKELDDAINKFKSDIRNEWLPMTCIGREILSKGILPQNIMLDYDAGWIAPDGTFYGMDGDTKDMLHLNLSEKLVPNAENPDFELEKQGYVKIHGRCVSATRDFTDEQVEAICNYCDKFKEGTIYNPFNSNNQIIKTSDFRAMDIFARRKAFMIVPNIFE